MDSNKNQECCYGNGGGGGGVGLTVVIGADRIAKAVSAVKYQNQFNNNNLIEQENLMPPVQGRVVGMVPDDGPPSTNGQQNGVTANESPGKEKVHLTENGSTRHLASSIFTQSSSPAVSAGSDALPDRLHPTLPECFLTGSTNNITNGFNPPTNGASPVSSSTGYTIQPPATSFDVAATSNGTAVDFTNNSNAPKADHPPLVAAANNDDTVDPADEGDFSDNNSLGNLSYASENGLVEEIILLPSNAYSDDDNASTSDDCIYAYRGGEPAGAAGQLLDLQGDLPPDDETDFLEMDFDPEPSSEMETFNRQQDGFLLGLDGEQYGAAAARPPEGGHGPEVDGGGGGPRSPTNGARQAAPVQIAAATVAEQHEQKGNETGLYHQAAEVGEARALFAGPLPSVAQPEDTQSNAQQESREQNATVSKSPEPAAIRTEAHKTGAIPKNLPIPVDRPPTLSSNSKNLRLDLTVHSDEPDFVETHRYQDCSLYYYQPAEFSASTSKRSKGLQQQQKENEAEEMHCLDCAEQEFLMRTKQDHPTRQRYCNSCNATKGEGRMRSSALKATDHRSVRSYAGPNRTAEAFYPRATEPRMDDEHGTVDDEELLDLRAEQIVFETLHKINTLKETPPTTAGPKAECMQSMAKGSIMPVLEKDDGAAKAQYDQIVPLVTHPMTQPKQCVTLYTVNCNEATITEAFMHLGLLPKESVLRQYATERLEADNAKMTIPQYLLHMSKRDCNYRKLIDVIKSCCDMEPLDVQYYPIDPFMDGPEIVQICSGEIAKHWNANTNLRQIIHFKHKHFHTLNVLGKIVNILRQPSRGRDTNYMISIPQYYKSGIIKIMRIAPPSW
uniref:Uncharacterized protein n=1 Tax=Anopheles melas TaxID=34690 RepID=A0A182U8S6_9DIPT